MLFQVSFPPVEVRCQSRLFPNKLMTLQTVNEDCGSKKVVTGCSGVNGLGKKNQNNLLSFFTLQLVFYGQFWSFCAQRWIFPENWVLYLKLHKKC